MMAAAHVAMRVRGVAAALVVLLATAFVSVMAPVVAVLAVVVARRPPTPADALIGEVGCGGRSVSSTMTHSIGWGA
jgi:hypothetical protein